jgi:hypothetical protein
MLQDFLTTRYDDIVTRGRAKGAERRAPKATDGEVQHGS